MNKQIEHVEKILCDTNLTPKKAKKLFRKAKTVLDLGTLMICVVLGRIPSPIYNFEPVEKENPDNVWWRTTKAWEYLVLMNVHGYITDESEEGGIFILKDEQVKDIVGEDSYKTDGTQGNHFFTRSSVGGMMDSKKADKFIKEMNLLGFISWKSPVIIEKNKIEVSFPRSYGPKPQLRLMSSIPVNIPFSRMVLESVSNELLYKIINTQVQVIVFDPIFTRKGEDALFPAIVNVLSHNTD